MNVKNKMFVELEYTGKVKEDDIVFDTTDEETAKKNNIYDKNSHLGPITICIGEGQILAGLEEELVGKEVGKEYDVELPAEKAFGKKDGKLVQLIPASKFKQQNIKPMPGMQLNIDGMMGTIKTASGGRVLVDFNHPLSGKDLVYHIKINKVVEDDAEKIKAYLKLSLADDKIDVKIEEGKAKIYMENKVPEDVMEKIEEKIKELVTGVKGLEFTFEERKK